MYILFGGQTTLIEGLNILTYKTKNIFEGLFLSAFGKELKGSHQKIVIDQTVVSLTTVPEGVCVCVLERSRENY